jgi:hypothetical protein
MDFTFKQFGQVLQTLKFQVFFVLHTFGVPKQKFR